MIVKLREGLFPAVELGWAGLRWAGLGWDGLGAVAALISIHCEVFVSALEPGDGEVVCLEPF